MIRCSVAVGLFIALSTPAIAAAAEIDFSVALAGEDPKGPPLNDCAMPQDCEKEKPPLLLGKVARRALLATYPDEPNLSGEEKYKRGKLADRLWLNGKETLSVEDVALLKKLISKGYGPLIVTRALDLLDPPAK